jgi:transcriptional regulator GlxA family with amidase domain
MSFRALLVRKRLQAAMELLRQSDLSVLQIALATGFQDLAHFHRLFRRRVGITPARYRSSGRA